MKKNLALILVILLGAAYFYLTTKKDTSVNYDKYIVEDKMPVHKEIKESPIKSVMKDIAKLEKPSDNTKPKIEKDIEDRWEDTIKVIFINDQDFSDYQVMQKAYEEDRLDAYEEFMETQGQSEAGFRITELEEGKYKEIEEQYLKAFEKRFGKEVLKKYLDSLATFNDANSDEKIFF